MSFIKTTGESTFVFHTTHPLFVAEVGKKITIVWTENCNDPIAAPNPNEVDEMKRLVMEFMGSGN